MKFMLAVLTEYGATAAGAASPAWLDCAQAMRKAGVLVEDGTLEPPATSTTIRAANSGHVVSDGPRSRADRQLARYFIIDVASADDAARWAAGCAVARNEAIVIRRCLRGAELPAAVSAKRPGRT